MDRVEGWCFPYPQLSQTCEKRRPRTVAVHKIEATLTQQVSQLSNGHPVDPPAHHVNVNDLSPEFAPAIGKRSVFGAGDSNPPAIRNQYPHELRQVLGATGKLAGIDNLKYSVHL